MIRPDQIPDEVMRAFARELDLTGEYPAAIAAALGAWTGAFPWTFNGPLEGTGYVLPLPQKKRDQPDHAIVWCIQCGRSERVNSVKAMTRGWPQCCGYTMTIDSPSERAALGEQS